MNRGFEVVRVKSLSSHVSGVVFGVFRDTKNSIPQIISLTDRAVVNLKPKAKASKKYDSCGLRSYVSHPGGKFWRLTYRRGGKESLSLVYPAVTLAVASQRRDKVRM